MEEEDIPDLILELNQVEHHRVKVIDFFSFYKLILAIKCVSRC